MPYQVSQATQRLDIAYDVLTQLIKSSTGDAGTNWHVLSAARALVHREYLASFERDRKAERAERGHVDGRIPPS